MAITYEQAVAASEAFLKRADCYQGCRYVGSNGIAVSDGWFFEFQIARLDGQPLGPNDAFGGAPGFISATDASVRAIGWKELFDRRIERNTTPGAGE